MQKIHTPLAQWLEYIFFSTIGTDATSENEPPEYNQLFESIPSSSSSEIDSNRDEDDFETFESLVSNDKYEEIFYEN